MHPPQNLLPQTMLQLILQLKRNRNLVRNVIGKKFSIMITKLQKTTTKLSTAFNKGVNPGGDGGEMHPPQPSLPIIYRTLLFLTIYLADLMASRFLLWLRIGTAFFLFTHLINKGQPSIVRIAEKKMKLCFLYAAEQRCSKKKRDERC